MRSTRRARADILRRAQVQARAGVAAGGICVTCAKAKCHEPHSFAFLMTGAMWMDRDGEVGGPHPRMRAFWSMGWHGAHDGGMGSRRNDGASVEVLDDIPSGQADLQFCSTRCLRRFFSALVDAIEPEPPRSRARRARRT